MREVGATNWYHSYFNVRYIQSVDLLWQHGDAVVWLTFY
jgi:hypothetical protein